MVRTRRWMASAVSTEYMPRLNRTHRIAPEICSQRHVLTDRLILTAIRVGDPV